MELSPELINTLQSASPWVLATVFLGSMFIKQYFAFKIKKLDEDGELRRLEIEKEEKDYSDIQDRLTALEAKQAASSMKLDTIEEKLINLLYKLSQDPKQNP